MKKVISAALLIIIHSGFSLSEAYSSSVKTEPLLSGTVSERLSLGFDVDYINREISDENGSAETLEALSGRAYLGCNLFRWLTVFIKAGAIEAKGDEWFDYNYGLSISGGVNTYLWHAEVHAPFDYSGRFTIKNRLEIGKHSSDTDDGSISWLEYSTVLPFGYQLFDRSPDRNTRYTSLTLYAGPAFSYFDGEISTPVDKTEFNSKNNFGAVAGIDISFAPFVSIGVEVLYFNDLSYGCNLRFYF